jgi:hypothetical protein
MSSVLKSEGFVPPAVPAELARLRETAGTSTPSSTALSVLQFVVREEKQYLLIPESSALSFPVDDDLKRRLGELSTQFERPPPAMSQMANLNALLGECSRNKQVVLKRVVLSMQADHGGVRSSASKPRKHIQASTVVAINTNGEMSYHLHGLGPWTHGLAHYFGLELCSAIKL